MKSTLKIFTFLFISILCSSISLDAQKTSFNDVMRVKLRNMGPIIKDKQVNGYYLFYKVDKVDRKTNSYKLQILDQNLESIATKKINDTKYLYLLEGSYNGNAIMLKFYDSKERIVKYKMYDPNGELITSKSQELTKMEASLLLGPSFNEDDILKNDVRAIEGKGFVDYIATKGKGNGYSIRFFADTKGAKNWKKGSNIEEKGFKMASFVTYNDEMLISSLIKKKNAISRDMDFFIMGHDLATGKKLFEKSLTNNKYKLQIMSGYQTDEGFVLIGTYFGKDEKVLKAKSTGMVALKVDKEGNLNDEKYVKWSEMGKFVETNSKDRIKGLGHVYFHRFVQMEDGKIYGIGESYKKAASGVGIAAAALGGNASLSKMVIEDMLIFEFSSDFNLEDVHVFDKGKSNFQLPQGASMASPHLLATYLDLYGAFDYDFTQEAKDGSYFIVGYTDFKRVKGEKNGFVFGTISNADGEFNQDDISLKTDATNIRVYPAKNGHVLFAEYFRKAKKMDLRIEKLNF